MILNSLNLFLIIASINYIISAEVEITSDGVAVFNIPITFTAKLKGETPIDVNQFWYVFEDRGISPPHRTELVSGREASFTITYEEGMVGKYRMKVQVFVDIWGWKGWLIAQNELSFKLQNQFVVNLVLNQSGVSDKALKKGIVAANKTIEMTAEINGSEFLKNASNNYIWFLDGRTLGPYTTPDLNYTFVSKKDYQINIVVTSNITISGKKITKFGNKNETIKVKNEIKAVTVTGNTFILDGALLQLQVNCSGGDPPFQFCYDFFREKITNFSCEPMKLLGNDCYFPLIHYFPRNGTHFIELMVFDELNFSHKSIKVIVYEIVRKTQLVFVILPIMSCILALIIIVVGIAYHLQQRQRLNETLEVADFDFQNNDNLMVKTFFERVRESLASALRETLIHPCNTCNPCTRPNNCEELIDDTLPNEPIINGRNNFK